MSTIDVVILSWNRVDDTITAINSCLEQENIHLELYVVDQGSDQKCKERLVSEFGALKNVHFEFLDNNIGVARGRNLGNALGQSRYVFSLDNDAKLVDRNTLSVAVKYMDRNPHISVLTFKIIDYWVRDNQVFVDGPRNFSSTHHHVLNEEFTCIRFSGGAHILRRDTFEKVFGYDENLFFGGEEEDLSQKIIISGGMIVYNPTFSVMHKTNAHCKTNWKNNRFFYLVRNKLYLSLKYDRNMMRFCVLALGYLIKGCVNGIFIQTFAAIINAIKTYKVKANEFKDDVYGIYLPNEYSKDYYLKYEKSYRGNFFNLLMSKVLVKLPKV